jgi:hypothetical protein
MPRLIALVLVLLAVALAPSPAAAAAQDLLPDLDQETPNELTVAGHGGAGAHFELGFESAVRNIGAGPLLIDGSRPDTHTPQMTAKQRVNRADGSQTAVGTPDRLQYAVSRTHQHWHLLHFDRYLLRRAGARGAVVRDQKTGFCLGDRYRVTTTVVPAAPDMPRLTGSCGLRQRNRLTVSEGISPGYGDNYRPYLEGQSLPLTGLHPGRYVLVHRVNAGRALLESDYGNNAASVLIELRWRRGRPLVTELAGCPDTERCDRLPGPLSAHHLISSIPDGAP